MALQSLYSLVYQGLKHESCQNIKNVLGDRLWEKTQLGIK